MAGRADKTSKPTAAVRFTLGPATTRKATRKLILNKFNIHVKKTPMGIFASTAMWAALDLGLEKGPDADSWILKPVPLEEVLDHAYKAHNESKTSASSQKNKSRFMLRGWMSWGNHVNVFKKGGTEYVMVNIANLTGQDFKELPLDVAEGQETRVVAADGEFMLADTLPLVRQAVAALQGHSDIGLLAVPSNPAAPETPTTTVLALALSAPNGKAWVVHFEPLSPANAREAWDLVASLLGDPDVVKVTHDALWLGPAVRRACGKAIAPLWDTQVAVGVGQLIAGVGGALTLDMQPNFTLKTAFDASGITDPELTVPSPSPSSWLASKLPDANRDFLAAQAVHLLLLADELKDDLGTMGTAAVMPMSMAYAECLLPEGQRGYVSSGTAAKGSATALPRDIPLEVFFQALKDAEPGGCKALYRLGPQNEDGIAGTVPPDESGGRVWAPRAPSAATDEDPAQNEDLQSMLRLFPEDVAAAVVAVCRGEPAACGLGDDGRQSPPPASSSSVSGLDVKSEGARGFLWPIEIVVDEGRPMAVRLSDRSMEDLPKSAQIDVTTALRALEDAKDPFGGGSSSASSIFTSDNRAGIPGALHRISAMRGRQEEIVGLTYRVGRHLEGVGELLRDVLSRLRPSGAAVSPAAAAAMGLPASRATDYNDDSTLSLLLLGPPGFGKTTLLRDISRLLANDFRRSVVIVDTSAEIGGDGVVPHHCIGRARRMWVPHRDRQHEVMREAVQNHTPDVVVIDEISDAKEVAAARTIAQRGVVLVGTAHGNSLEDLMKNPELNALVGGVTTVTVGDAAAQPGPGGSFTKTKQERRGAPCFTSAIELLGRSQRRIHWDVAQSVDALLAGRRPETQLRWTAPDGRFMAMLEGGDGGPHPGDKSVLKAAQLASKALKGDPEAVAEWVADLSLLAARYVENE